MLKYDNDWHWIRRMWVWVCVCVCVLNGWVWVVLYRTTGHIRFCIKQHFSLMAKWLLLPLRVTLPWRMVFFLFGFPQASVTERIETSKAAYTKRNLTQVHFSRHFWLVWYDWSSPDQLHTLAVRAISAQSCVFSCNMRVSYFFSECVCVCYWTLKLT